MNEYAGLDWTGTPTPDARDVYGVGVVTVPDLTEADDILVTLRQKWSKPGDFEIHGHTLTENQILDVIQDALESLRVTIILFRVSELTEYFGLPLSQVADSAAGLIARPALTHCLEKTGIKRLWYDKGDIEGIPRQKAFRTAIAREARTLLPTRTIEVKPVPSHKNTLIQLADVFAYAVQREQIGTFKTKGLTELVRRLWKRESNEIRWGSGIDLRPYLPP